MGDDFRESNLIVGVCDFFGTFFVVASSHKYFSSVPWCGDENMLRCTDNFQYLGQKYLATSSLVQLLNFQ